MGEKFTPAPIVVRTALDEHGSLLDISRIAGEDLVSYSKRLFDTYANRASSTYEGLINGINRELDLEKEDSIEVRVRGLGFGGLDDPSITVTATTISNVNSYTNIIDGAAVTAVGAILTDSTQSWTPKHLRGYFLKINTETYEVIDNTATTVTVSANMSGLVGATYIVEVDWTENGLVGLGIEIGNSLFKIAENTPNILKIEAGDLTSVIGTEYKVRAFNPKVEVTGARFLLYKEFSNLDNFQLEKEFNLREDVRFHKDIVTEINQLKFFEASDLLDSRTNLFAFTLKRQSSENTVIKETVPAAKFFKLQNKRIKEDSVRFTEANIFLREVDEDSVSQSVGNYYIDYNTGVVLVNTTPSGEKPVSYMWNDFPFTVTASPIIINPLNKDDSEEFLFLQKEMIRYNSAKERFRSSVPKADMIEYMAELLAVKPENWGE